MPLPAADNDRSTYWAAQPDSERAAANVLEKIRRYRKWLEASGRAARMRRAFSAYYGRAPDGQGDTSRTGQSGEHGEYVELTLNKFATLLNQSVVRTTAEKPAFRSIATNADSASMEQATFAQGLLDYYSSTMSIADRDWEMVEIGNLCSEGWQIHGWDTTAGKNLTDFAEEAPTHEGDIEAHATTPFRVAYDPDAENFDRLKWVAFKRRYNRHDLAASLRPTKPDAAAELLEMSDDRGHAAGSQEYDADADLDLTRASNDSDRDADLIWVWEFRHLPTPALPNGRLLRFSGGVVLYDSFVTGEDGAITDNGYPYNPTDLHAYRYCPANVVGSVAGHAPAWDLLGLQEMKDTLATMAASAANAGGLTNLWCRTGDKPIPSQLVGSLQLIESAVKPERIEGIELSDQVPALDAMLDANMMSRMGESDVSMGDVPKGMPGNLAALLEAKTVQYASRAQASYAHVLERSRTGMLKMLQRFAKSERVAVLGGISKGYAYKTWSAPDLKGADRFVVESVSPLTSTYAGRKAAAEEMLSNGMIPNGKAYLLFLATGRLEPMLEAPQQMELGVAKEAELVRQGTGLAPVDPASFATGVPAFVDDGQKHIRPLKFDRHWEHILEDLAVLASPTSRDDGATVTAVMGVVEERLRMMRDMDPVMMAVLGYPPEVAAAISMAGMGMMPPPTGAPQKAGAPPPPKNPAVEGLPAGAPRIAAPKPARPPRNPLTGEQPPSPVEGAQ